jgi:signal transduction histidine kinase
VRRKSSYFAVVQENPVAVDSARDRAQHAPSVNERFAALIKSDRATILQSFQQRMKESNNPLITDPCSHERAMRIGSEIVTDVAESVRAGGVQIDDSYKLLCWTLGEAQARSHLTPADSLRAAVAFFDVTVDTITGHVRDDPDLLPCFVVAILALNESATLRIREATLAYTGSLIHRIHHAHLNERRRVARELHDRLGEGLSVALRQLELDEITTRPDGSLEPPPRTGLGKDVLVEAMRRLRLVISDLRQDPVTSLEKALTHYLDSIAADVDVDVRLRVSGDERWASPVVIDETYMIMREAIRNSIKHGAPQMILIGVDLAPHELRAWVEDDGQGFVTAKHPDGVVSGTAGLASMRERVALIGGRLTITSAPGQGTEIELLVPLSGNRDD